MDDLVLQRAYQNLTQDMQRSQGRSSGGGATNSSSATPGCSQESLLASLMQKVMALESENAALKQQLAAATSAAGPQQPPSTPPTAAAASEADTARTSAPALTGPPAEAAASMPALQPDCQQCKQAWQLVEEMKSFLADYGLTWVGDAGTPAQPSSSSTHVVPASAAPAAGSPHRSDTPGTSSGSSSRGLPFDLQDLQVCIQDLNELVHAGEACIAPVSGPASSPAWRQLQVQEAVPLLVFRDGLQLGTSPMRAYEDATATAILCDLFEGYFPGVLKKQYPEGVPLQLVDCSHLTMREAAAKGPGAASSGRKLTSFSELGQAVPVTHLQQVGGGLPESSKVLRTAKHSPVLHSALLLIVSFPLRRQLCTINKTPQVYELMTCCTILSSNRRSVGLQCIVSMLQTTHALQSSPPEDILRTVHCSLWTGGPVGASASPCHPGRAGGAGQGRSGRLHQRQQGGSSSSRRRSWWAAASRAGHHPPFQWDAVHGPVQEV